MKEKEEDRKLAPPDESGENDALEAVGAAAERDAEEAASSDEKAAKALRKLVAEDDDDRLNLSLRTILGGDILAGRWFRRQFWFMVMIAAMCIFYVGNRYYCQREMLEGTKLSDTLLDRRYKVLTVSSQLKEMERPSVVQKHLSDTTLKTSTTPIFSLPVDAADTLAAH